MLSFENSQQREQKNAWRGIKNSSPDVDAHMQMYYHNSQLQDPVTFLHYGIPTVISQFIKLVLIYMK